MGIYKWLEDAVGPLVARAIVAILTALLAALADAGLLDGQVAAALSGWLSNKVSAALVLHSLTA